MKELRIRLRYLACVLGWIMVSSDKIRAQEAQVLGSGRGGGGKMRTLNWDMLNLMCPCDPQVEMSIRELLS